MYMENKNSEIEQILWQIAINCAPTILGAKPASLFCVKEKSDLIKKFENQQPLIEKVFGVKVFELKKSEDHLVLLLYNLKWLDQILSLESHKQFLKSIGYLESISLEGWLSQLSERFKYQCPHEIGIFLGYPLSDVQAFIEPKSECLHCGYWKVYSEVDAAKVTFEKYDNAKKEVVLALEAGVNLFELNKYLLVRSS
ncbi:DUF3793 family protein [Fusibacter sp. 3D3]|uniref:DUF3793 family protein n=1 Tax=Fusibacter sp. 3D3 TaxID=1048380 RepID=UPI0008531AB3|nr:DUF3793 family protein [Fusibacter sp. 3D3]GAU75958.1 hypothetical protein F3D3_0554 [Fusibacter sp. 3D3]